MPPTLDLSGATHPKMIVVPPRINLRRAASYNHADRGPLSSTSSRFSFNHLLFTSPPPSPKLPSLVPPAPRKPSTVPRPSRVLKLLLWAVGGLLVLYLGSSAIGESGVELPRVVTSFAPPYQHDVENYERVSPDLLPDHPTPIIFNDRKGNARWAVSIPSQSTFPLSVKQYADMWAKCRTVSARVAEMRHPGKGNNNQRQVPGPRTTDRYFVDVLEAEKLGFLPGQPGNGWGDRAGTGRDDPADQPLCSSSLTFVLESADAGIGRTLMNLWLSYGLAQRHGRSFFVIDSRWAYGEYTEIFKAPPVPSCRPPRSHEMLPCPHHARHLVVTSATAEDVITAMLGGEDATDSLRPSQGREKARFDLARDGYEALFQLNSQDQEYVLERVEHLRSKTQVPSEGQGHGDGIIVGVHVRRGDRHPAEFEYRGSYVPVDVYADRAQRVVDLTYNSTRAFDVSGRGRSLVVVASDDPMVYEAEEFSSAARAQERIRLASKTAIQQANPDRSVMHKFVDETFGWEGGFFAAMFWNLGLPPSLSVPAKERSTEPPSTETLRLRSLVGRAYMMDLAVLALASDVVICTVSAMGCRLLAVMMGWEKSITQGYWVNIDGDFGWDGEYR